MSDRSTGAAPGTPPMPEPPRVAGAPAEAIVLDGLLAGLAGALVLELALVGIDRLSSLARSAALETVGPNVGAPETATLTAAGMVVAYAVLLTITVPTGLALSWWVSRLPRFPSSGSAWLAAAAGLGIGVLILDRETALPRIHLLVPWGVLGAITPAAAAMPFVLWCRQPRLVQNRRDLKEDEP